MTMIFIVMCRPWNKQKEKYGEWMNLSAHTTSKKASEAIRERAVENSYEDYLPVEYSIEPLWVAD